VPLREARPDARSRSCAARRTCPSITRRRCTWPTTRATWTFTRSSTCAARSRRARRAPERSRARADACVSSPAVHLQDQQLPHPHHRLVHVPDGPRAAQAHGPPQPDGTRQLVRGATAATHARPARRSA
jgi:hypothetical protein